MQSFYCQMEVEMQAPQSVSIDTGVYVCVCMCAVRGTGQWLVLVTSQLGGNSGSPCDLQ